MIKDYYLYDQENTIIEHGRAHEDDVIKMAFDMNANFAFGEIPAHVKAVKPREPSVKEKRRLAYPDINEFADAQVKLTSPDPYTIAEGQAQLDAYYADCLAVKARFPKE